MRKYKKIVSAITILSMCASYAAALPVFAADEAAAPSPIAVELGDVNADGYVNAVDAASIRGDIVQYAFTGVSGLKQEAAADVNQDGSVNAVDAALVLGYAAQAGAGNISGTLEEYAKDFSNIIYYTKGKAASAKAVVSIDKVTVNQDGTAILGNGEEVTLETDGENYLVPVPVRVKGDLCVAQFGLQIDSKVSDFAIETGNSDFYSQIIAFKNLANVSTHTEGNSAWLIWGDYSDKTVDGEIAALAVLKVPKNAEAGTTYAVDYLEKTDYTDNIFGAFGQKNGTYAYESGSVVIAGGETPAAENKFVDGANNWSFANSYENFGDSYYINETYMTKLTDGLSNTEKKEIEELLSEPWGGSCYGMACTSILSCYDILNPADYQKKANFLHDISKPPTDDVKSLINYYFALQATDEVRQHTIQARSQTEEEKINQLLEQLKDGSPTLLTFFLGGGGGHAVVAYDVEYGSFTINKKVYNAKVITYDNNAVDLNDDFCMYINTSDNSWVIPYYTFANTRYGAILGLTTDNLDVINYHGYLNGKADSSIQEFIPVLSLKAIDSDNISLRRIKMTGDTWTVNTEADDEFKWFSNFTDENSTAPADMKCAIKGSKGFVMNLKQNEAVDMSMRYENDRIQVDFADTSEVVFDPSGYVEVSGNSSAYHLDFVSNDGYAPTDWYEMTASGTASEVKFYKSSDGYVMKADSLRKVSLSAVSDNATAACQFSTGYKEVFIYEIDENTIGVAVDTDGDGKYEKKIAQSGDLLKGDADGSGRVDILDAITLNKAILGKELISDQQVKAIDFNENGKPDSAESLILLKYIVGLIDNFDNLA